MHTDRKTGYWVEDRFCSVCKRFPIPVDMGVPIDKITEHFDFCPHCGSDMVGVTVETFRAKGT